jgi:hypothetical protein
LLEGEIAGYQSAYARARARGELHAVAVQEVLIAELVSAQFLFRTELVPETGYPSTAQYELAARLSYLLWSSTPDAALLDIASKNQLETDEQLAAAVASLLKDPRSARFTKSFAGQWLVTPRSYPSYPNMDYANLRTAAGEQELFAFFGELLEPNRSFGEFLTSRVHFVNDLLAPTYGLQVTGRELQRIEVTEPDRRGVLASFAFLARGATTVGSSPSKRGAWILQRLLCAEVAPAPADMPTFSGDNWAIRDYLAKLPNDASCAGCHIGIDSVGLAFEGYDAVGTRRTEYRYDKPVDTSTVLHASPQLPDGEAVPNAARISELVAQSPAYPECVVRQLYTYAHGRTVPEGERTEVRALSERWHSGAFSLRELLVELVQAPAFRGGAR